MFRTIFLLSVGGAVLAAVGHGAGEAADPPARGRDPFVFRAIFEDKTRMCLIALRPELFLAYDPATCSLERASGGVEYRGKVYDFSQQNSRAVAPVWFAQPAVISSLTDTTVLKDGFEATGVAVGESLRFEADGAALLTPYFDVSRFDDVAVLFDEKSRRAPFRVEVLADGVPEPVQWFESTLHRDRDTEWQENLKRIVPDSGRLRLRWVARRADDAKELRRLRVFGAYRAWSAMRGEDTARVTPDWGGYVRRGPNGTERVILRYGLVLDDGARIAVEESPEAIVVDAAHAAIERRFSISGLPAGARLRMSLAGAARDATYRVSGAAASLRDDAGDLVFEIDRDGECRLEQWWGRP
jgi:hypothetical protein